MTGERHIDHGPTGCAKQREHRRPTPLTEPRPVHQHDRPIPFGERWRQQRSHHRPDTNCQISCEVAAGHRRVGALPDVGHRFGRPSRRCRRAPTESTNRRTSFAIRRVWKPASYVPVSDPVGELVDGRRVAPGRHVEHVEHDAHVEAVGDCRRRSPPTWRPARSPTGSCSAASSPGPARRCVADVEHVAGDRLEDRTVRLEDRRRDRRTSARSCRARAPATPPETGPSVYVTPTLGEPCRDFAGDLRSDGREVDDGGDAAVGGGDDLVDDRRSVTAPSGTLSSTVSALRERRRRRLAAAIAPSGRRSSRAGGVEARRARSRRAATFAAIGRAHVAEADEADDASASSGRRLRAVMPSASSTWRARRNASTPAGTPAYTAIWISVSRSSSSVQPLRSAPRKCVLNSSPRFSAASRQRLLRLRCRSVSAERPQTSPQQYSVTSCWNSRLKLSALANARVDVLLAEHAPARLQADVEQLLVHRSSPSGRSDRAGRLVP